MAFVAFLDACVLYPANLRDVLLTIAEAEIYQVRWSPDVLDEVQRNVAKSAKIPSDRSREEGARYLRETIEHAFPDALVARDSYKDLIDGMPNDPKDRHVLAAAVAVRADVLVTANIKHFSADSVAPFDIDIQDPDTFLCYQLDLAPRTILGKLMTLANDRRPPLDSLEGILNALAKTTPRFSEMATEYWRKFHPPPG